MDIETTGPDRSRSRRRRSGAPPAPPAREADYRSLRNPFPVMEVFSADEIAAMHLSALSLLEDLGVKVLLPEARRIFRDGGARVDDDSEMVFISRDMVDAALAAAPRTIPCRALDRARDFTLELGSLTFQPGAGAPHATDLKRGRRPATGSDFRELTRLTQHFDVFQMVSPLVEPQDIPTHIRHYFTVEAQLSLTDKFPFFFSRGTPQILDSFEMLALFSGLSDDALRAESHCYTIINTNSPRTLDIPMAQGLIDFARYGQLAIVTPFTLMGAMAPITVAGAVTLSHAEALAAITLSQLTRPGAPVCYGTFTSNVDMKSGAPAMGTPSHFHASLAAGQLARHIGLPWRCAAGSSSNLNDVQAANENQFALWGCLMAGATVIIHSAGWLEGGLSVSYEKLITDAEVLNMVAELCAGAKAGPDEIGIETAIAEVAPGGHFFATTQTMARYATEFYQPIVHDYANFGTWAERGAEDASTRATGVWQEILASGPHPRVDADRLAEVQAYIARRTAEGGAPPES
ncbi:trimethylamine methyltransferase family protein [Ovoidimarina sediminis]|uniref:trimethylamine methyltransferase family protein n=1 Tax=Ovoidimarina sediminis TaxID=3079856 RepID=UPI002915A6F3|nr:trimethylamine methyltransferase family protein [Rhodophyticola sp. MJ-SS7]MDU8945202.1 trimethylamine methyltransferase family protein [Rhodophyticola sp. MJ-SS7]